MHITKYIKNGKTLYKFQGYVGTDLSTGKRIRVTRTGFNSPKECDLEFCRIKLEFENGPLTKNKKYTYQEVYDLWIEQYKNTVRSSTLNKTLCVFKTHILPIFKNKYIDMISINDCQLAINKWHKTLKNYKVTNNYCGLVFKYAIKNNIGNIKDNPTRYVEIPKPKEDIEDEEINKFYTKVELIKFLDCVKSKNNIKWYALFRTLSYSGMRKGELLALTWNDINFKDNTIRVNKTLSVMENNTLGIQPPKTKKSKRVITMDLITMNLLKDWKTQQAKDMLKLGYNVLNNKQIVFTNTKNEHIALQKVGQKIDSICNEFNLKRITPHGFRHTHCSLLLMSNIPIKEVQTRLGHSDIQTTMNIYAHISKEQEEETILKFAQYMSV